MPGTQRWKAWVAYDGTEYHGWQSQPNGMGVQDFIERRLEQLFEQPVRLIGSGRTDAGVHAEAQVFHFDGDWDHGPEVLLKALRTGYPDSIQVWQIEPAEPGFHAHMSATGKHYRYQFYEGWANPFQTRYVWSLGNWRLDIEKMNRAARSLIGTHDFSAFGANRGDGKPPDCLKELRSLEVKRVEGPLIHLTTSGSGYMYKMVRSLAGCLRDVGIGKLPVDAVGEILESRTRTNVVKTAPAKGLVLERVEYGSIGEGNPFQGTLMGWKISRTANFS